MKFRSRRRAPIEANLTPLIDVVFLLLIFFMVSTTFTHENQMRINLPEAQADALQVENNQINIMILQNGNYSVNGKAVANRDIETLIEALRIETGAETDHIVVISADSLSSHQSVVRAMDAAGRLGLTQVRITSQESLTSP